MTAKTVFFGEWVALRRKALDMTQRALATQTKCALVTIKKIELGERRPSRELAEAIASSLEVATLHRITFVECARGLRTAESLPAPETRPAPQAGITGTTSEANQANAPTPLIGRAAEIAHILKTLQRDDCRLLTLVGTGGAGKTRLAAEAAHVLRNLFPDGTVVIPLASVNDATHIAAAVAHALQLSLSRPAERELRHYLRDKNMLLVLDNCEQLIEGISCLTDWLSAAPALKLLVTSRERLRLAEEWVYPVPMLAEAHAAALFEHTAHRANPTVVLSDQQDKIASICRQVECLPLAVEIAAGWTPVLSCAEIARNIQHDLDFLSSSVRNVPDRHRSMRAVFEHSWGLLSLPEQAVLMRLSVFRGGCAQAQANTVADATLPILRALLEKSLVHADRTGRFDLHALIHQFAAEKLRASGANDETEQRHFQGFLALAGTLDTESQTARGITAFAQLDLEHDNMRAALGWALRLGDLTLARQLVDKLTLYWWRRGHWAEGERWTMAVAARPDEVDSPLLCWVTMDAAWFPALQGRYDVAYPHMLRAEEMAARLDDPETTLRILIIQTQSRSDIESATQMFETFFATARAVRAHSKAGLAAMVAAGHDLFGDRLWDAGRDAEARAQYQMSLAKWRQIGNLDGIAYPIGNLGRLALQAGHLQEACDQLGESVTLSRNIGNRVGVVDWLQPLATALLCTGDTAQAEAGYEEALALCEEMGYQAGMVSTCASLGYLALIKNERADARRFFDRSMRICLQLVELQPPSELDWKALLPPEVLLCVRGMALLALDEAVHVRALTLLSAADSLQPRLGRMADIGMNARAAQAIGMLRDSLDQETFVITWQHGRCMSPDAIIALVLDV